MPWKCQCICNCFIFVSLFGKYAFFFILVLDMYLSNIISLTAVNEVRVARKCNVLEFFECWCFGVEYSWNLTETCRETWRLFEIFTFSIFLWFHIFFTHFTSFYQWFISRISMVYFLNKSLFFRVKKVLVRKGMFFEHKM